MGKDGRFSIQFNPCIKEHQNTIRILNSLRKGAKAQLISDAINFYEKMQNNALSISNNDISIIKSRNIDEHSIQSTIGTNSPNNTLNSLETQNTTNDESKESFPRKHSAALDGLRCFK